VLNTFREVTENKGLSTVLYDDPEGSYIGESEVIKEFNRKLEKNPDLLLPEGYRKVKEKEIFFDYKLTDKIPMSEAFRVSFEIINDLFSGLGMPLNEPKS